MSKRFERLKCSICGNYLVRRYDNDYLNKHYPVVGVPRLLKESNMLIQKGTKRLWKCSNCNKNREISTLEYALIILDNMKGRYIIE